MANLKQQVLGKVSGALGDVVFRERAGKNIVSVRPSSFSTPMDTASINRRARFLMSVKLASSINSNVQLKGIWKLADPSGLSVTNKLVKSNYINTTPDDISSTMLLVPQGGFGISTAAVNKTPEQMQVDLNAIGTGSGIDPVTETKMRLLMLLFLRSPVVVENTPKFSFISLSSNIQTTKLTEPTVFTASLMSNQTILFNQYQESKLFFALITLDTGDNIIRHSITLPEA
jgi:hypothetical protein